MPELGHDLQAQNREALRTSIEMYGIDFQIVGDSSIYRGIMSPRDSSQELQEGGFLQGEDFEMHCVIDDFATVPAKGTTKLTIPALGSAKYRVTRITQAKGIAEIVFHCASENR